MTMTLTSHQFLRELESLEGVEHAVTEFENAAHSVGEARRFARDRLAAWGFGRKHALTDKVVLVLSELATNAVLHARTRPEGENECFGVVLAYKEDFGLGVLVADNTCSLPAIVHPPSATAEHGRGLVLVETVADGWAVTRRRTEDRHCGKGVWGFFRVPEPSGLPARHGVSEGC
ncbi:ATP-binding protein [Streptomyces sp. ODS05-4]|uniref:ATP-binding protein n=1 Tax=Streptomyces sp. ODS05-4 TaxID=2944939 RepID=UPI00210EE06E|nr:ATP-binding protein [Streptomyces sp. ODS05-4]